MARHSIELTQEEAELRRGIILDIEKIQGPVAWAENGKRIVALMALLEQRQAIPPWRWNWWTKPNFRHGYIKGSRKNLFERNQVFGQAIHENHSFLEPLRYFLDGADLPPALIDGFCEKVDLLGKPLSGSDVTALAQFARAQTRQFGLEPTLVDEEYFKLSLDCGIYVTHAQQIERFVRATRMR